MPMFVIPIPIPAPALSDSYHHFCNLTLLENRVLVHLKVAFIRIKHAFQPFAMLSYVEQYSCIFEITNLTKFHYESI